MQDGSSAYRIMEGLFQFLFKYSPIVFSKGEFTFTVDVSRGWPLLLIVGLLALVVMLYFKMERAISLRARIGLAGIRFSLFLLILFCLLQPAMRVSTVVPRGSFVAVLADDSQSMRIADEGSRRRIDIAQGLVSTESDFHQRLEEKFKLRWYTFSSSIARADASPELRAAGDGTNLASAVESILSDFHGLPLAAIMVMSDGANTVSADFSSLTQKLKANRIPLYILGLGREQMENDIELVKADVPSAVLQGSTISAALTLKGRQAKQARIHVREGQQTIKSQDVQLTRSGDVQTVTVAFTPSSAGLKHYVLAVEPLPGEIISENNQRNVMVMVKDEHPRVLYVEGEPRWEYGKLLAALRDEKNVMLSSFLRTAKNKYYRQGIETPEELIEGFPKTKDELFAYKCVILGSVEANFFSFDQLKNLEAFVAERGGGFLALGGRFSFSAGGYGNTPIADLLPVTLSDTGAQPQAITAAPVLTFNGRQHPTTQLDDDSSASIQAWGKLPALTIPEPLSNTKPGAIVLLEGRRAQGQPVVLLAHQRYGRGRALAFTAADSWRWQMQMESKDQSHERFWKQLLRYLVSMAPDQVMASTDHDAYDVSDPIRIRAEVNDRVFAPIIDAKVAARIRLPGGREEKVPLEWTAEGGGYVGETVAQENGTHTIEVMAEAGGETIGVARAGFIVGDLHREYRDAHQHAEFLRHLAEATGGRYYTSKTADRIPEEITYLDNQSSMRVMKELWDMPINFLLLIGLVSAEWLLRKRKRLP